MHNIGYLEFDEKTPKADIMAKIERIASREGDGYASSMTWHDKMLFPSLEKAKQYINDVDRGFYDDHAVRFKDYSNAKKTKKIEEYELKIKELNKAKMEYGEQHSVHSFQAQHIGCPKCKSKLNKDYLRGECCPLCRKDLRSKTTLDKIKWYEDKIVDYRNRIEEEKRKQEKSCKIMWLVKYEFHS